MSLIKPTDKVSLLINTAPLPGLSTEPISYEFIYGIGTYGLSPLEKAIGSKSTGEQVKLTIKTVEWEQLFGHLPPPRIDIFPDTNEFEIIIKIKSTAPAGNREVIRALANLTQCAGGCGCGCGGH